MSADTLVGTPDPPEERPTVVDIDIEIIPDATSPATPYEIIDLWLDITRSRAMFNADEVQNILLDIRNSLNPKDKTDDR